LIDYNGIKNRANWCSVIIKGSPKRKLLLGMLGLETQPEYGFGAINDFILVRIKGLTIRRIYMYYVVKYTGRLVL